jgi:hypothetical protein
MVLSCGQGPMVLQALAYYQLYRRCAPLYSTCCDVAGIDDTMQRWRADVIPRACAFRVGVVEVGWGARILRLGPAGVLPLRCGDAQYRHMVTMYQPLVLQYGASLPVAVPCVADPLRAQYSSPVRLRPSASERVLTLHPSTAQNPPSWCVPSLSPPLFSPPACAY